MSGPHEYVRLARELDGVARVLTLPLPGFGPGDALPGSASAAIEVLAEAILQEVDVTGLVLGGHSSGGWLAEAIAAHLEGRGAAPAGVLLLDTYPPQSKLLSRMLPLMLAATLAAGEGEERIDDTRLLAMGAYRRIFAGWRPESIEAPTAMVHASEPAWEVRAGDGPDWQPSRDLLHAAREVPGNHFTMMNEHAGSTAQAVEELLVGEGAGMLKTAQFVD
jgi:thioesterase domain-containing protein